jgi:large subunit ribosomal protein L23
MKLTSVLLSPVVTEKSTILQEAGKYVFKVDHRANKGDIARAVEMAFDVHVETVNTLRNRGKMKQYGRARTKQPDTKKAIVTLRDGETIQLFEGA